MKAYIKTGRDTHGNAIEQEVPCKENPLWWQKQNLSFTASGYGARIPTSYMVQYQGMWRRVYCICYSNSGSLFIGKKFDSQLTVDIWRD